MAIALRSMVGRLRARLSGDPDFAPTPSGASFHDDDHLLALADHLLAGATHFIETGTYVGDTLHYVSTRHPQVQCHSCEPSPERYGIARNHVARATNVNLTNVTSQEFMGELDADPKLDPASSLPVMWLDAHGFGFEWPLKQEVAWATSRFARAHVLIDDFEVPGQPQFGFDEYDGQTCTWSFIREELAARDDYRIVYPTYADRTSRFHPLRGWILISFGFGDEDVLAGMDTSRYQQLTLEEADELARPTD